MSRKPISAAPIRLNAADREFFAQLARVIFMNPFSEEREALLGRASPGHAGEALHLDPAAYGFAAEVHQRLERLAQGRQLTVRDFAERDRDDIRTAFLYEVYHRHVADLDQVIHAQLATPHAPVRVPFARDLLAALTQRGIDQADALRYLAIFFQLRRAFYFILDGLVGDSRSMRQLRQALWNAVFTHDMRNYDRCLWDRMEDFSTLLLGETGTGKGNAAAAIGRSGLIPFDARRGTFAVSFVDTFVAINLSQFPESLIESELFGHRKGAFTGAVEAHTGLFGQCHAHGALFLDEIGEAGVPIQIKLLRVLQERTYTPLGGHDDLRFAGRVIAATNRPLDELRDGGDGGRNGFRDDFYYRLCSDVIEMPTLRRRIAESPAELAQLVALLVARITGSGSEGLATATLATLARDLPADHAWPGNVRELEQAVRRVLLTGSYLPDITTGGDASSAFSRHVRAGALDARELLAGYCGLLYRQAGTYEEVARRTGLDRRTVKKYIEEDAQALQ